MPVLSGWSNWEVAYFNRLFFSGEEITFDKPGRIRFPRSSNAVAKRTLAGTHLHQSFWLGQDAPINLRPISPLELDFQPDSFHEYQLIQQLASRVAIEPQDFCPMIPIYDEWYIPAGGAGRTTWKLSRNTPYDLIDINYLTDYKPICKLDGVLQTVITSGSPSSGQVLVPEDVESEEITTPDLAGATYLSLLYPAKFLVCRVDVNEEIPDTDDFALGLSMEEFLPTREYAFSVP